MPTKYAARFCVLLLANCLLLTLLSTSSRATQVASYSALTTLTSLRAPSVARPGYLSPIIDPTFNTKVTRISDQTAFNSTKQYLRHDYSRHQVWNSDGTLLLLDYGDYPWYLVDGVTYKLIRPVYLPFYSLWSHSNPKIVYGTYAVPGYQRTQLVSCNIDTCNSNTPSMLTVIHDFRDEGFSFISIGQNNGNLSNDDRYAPIVGLKEGRTYVMVFDMVNRAIFSTLDLGDLAGYMPVALMSQSGNYVVIEFGSNLNTRGIEVYDRNLAFQRNILKGVSHADVGYDIYGNEVWVGAIFTDPGKLLVARRLDGGGEYILTNDAPGWRSSGHVSCRNVLRPGWCYMSDDGELTNILGYDEVFAMKIGPEKIGMTAVTYRFAHLHHTAIPTCGYACAPMAVPSPNGSKVLFASDWNGGPSAPVYSYVVEMATLWELPWKTYVVLS
jgi:hypothetical protein